MKSHPHLEVICGPMFSGKTTELIRRLRRAQIAGFETVLLRPEIDSTKLTHDGVEMPYKIVGNTDWYPFQFQNKIVGIDEVQFLDNCLYNILRLSQETVVIVAGVDTTFRYEPFSIVPQLLSYAEKIDKLSAICVICGEEATRTQRLINGTPAKRTSPTILVGEEDFYEARCSKCWEMFD